MNHLNSNISNMNIFIGTSNSSLNVHGTTQINFNAGGNYLTYTDSPGLNTYDSGIIVIPF